MLADLQRLRRVFTRTITFADVTFEEYLIKKKIDLTAFSEGDSEHFNEWKKLFDQISEASFTAQKLYLINNIRRKFPTPREADVAKPAATVAKAKPIIKPRPKIN